MTSCITFRRGGKGGNTNNEHPASRYSISRGCSSTIVQHLDHDRLALVSLLDSHEVPQGCFSDFPRPLLRKMAYKWLAITLIKPVMKDCEAFSANYIGLSDPLKRQCYGCPRASIKHPRHPIPSTWACGLKLRARVGTYLLRYVPK